MAKNTGFLNYICIYYCVSKTEARVQIFFFNLFQKWVKEIIGDTGQTSSTITGPSINNSCSSKKLFMSVKQMLQRNLIIDAPDHLLSASCEEIAASNDQDPPTLECIPEQPLSTPKLNVRRILYHSDLTKKDCYVDGEVQQLMLNLLKQHTVDSNTAHEKRCRTFCDSIYYSMISIPKETLHLFQGECLVIKNKYLNPQAANKSQQNYVYIPNSVDLQIANSQIAPHPQLAPENLTKKHFFGDPLQLKPAARTDIMPRFLIKPLSSVSTASVSTASVSTHPFITSVTGPLATSTQIPNEQFAGEGGFIVPSDNSTTIIINDSNPVFSKTVDPNEETYDPDASDVTDSQQAYTDTEDNSHIFP